jgi:hypothetical protein
MESNAPRVAAACRLAGHVPVFERHARDKWNGATPMKESE